MRYDISKASAPSMPNLKKDRKHVKILLKMPQKTCRKPSFRCFFLFWRHICLSEKISLKASYGRIFALSGHFHTRKWQS